MSNFSDIKNIQEIIIGSLTILISLGVVIKPIRIWVKNTIKVFIKNRKTKSEVPAIVSQIYEKVNQIDTRLKDVEYEIKDPNSGGTIKGALKLIKAEIDATNWLSPRPTFRTTSSGINIFVNDAYCQLLGCSSDEILRLGWKNFVIDDEQADDYYKRFLTSSKNLSQFASKLKIQSKQGQNRGEWLVRIKPLGPIVDGGKDDYMWHGVFHPSDEIAKNYASSFGIPLNS